MSKNSTKKKPTYHCAYCKCDRRKPCGCHGARGAKAQIVKIDAQEQQTQVAPQEQVA